MSETYSQYVAALSFGLVVWGLLPPHSPRKTGAVLFGVVTLAALKLVSDALSGWSP